jgi:hypothetical protein
MTAKPKKSPRSFGKIVSLRGYRIEKTVVPNKVRLIGSVDDWGVGRISLEVVVDHEWKEISSMSLTTARSLEREVEVMRKLLKV